ncbi:unnamed protein product [Rodentolepis nana]|uniref:Uncharacterized protein n=1 Tax=Rodentolepis nana TaxID=102285 RepID=A0A0R3TYK9_RODNA|nr:unnamed protein product [Rodentolepis nana]
MTKDVCVSSDLENSPAIESPSVTSDQENGSGGDEGRINPSVNSTGATSTASSPIQGIELVKLTEVAKWHRTRWMSIIVDVANWPMLRPDKWKKLFHLGLNYECHEITSLQRLGPLKCSF